MITVYVPDADKLTVIDRGSGIVGTVEAWPVHQGDHVLIDYEGNRYGAVNLRTFADRVARAWDRQSVRYPTVARMVVHKQALVEVGEYDQAEGVVRVTNAAALADWLDVEVIDPAELHVTN